MSILFAKPQTFHTFKFPSQIKAMPLKFMFSKKATKINEVFTVDLTVTTYCQIDGEYFVNFCGLLRKHEL